MKEKIEKFWNWFSDNCNKFGSKFENTSLLEELDTRVTSLGDYSWEVGPGKIKENALTISPNGILKLLPETQKIIEHAKTCKDWEYYYAKQPKDWDFVFEYETNDGTNIEINSSSWQYVLLKYEDGMFTIVIEAKLPELNDDELLAVSEIALDSILGEELRIKTICEIDVVLEIEQKYEMKKGNIQNLFNHLNSLTSK
jgi:hypothetical protein